MAVEIWPVIHVSLDPVVTIENARIAHRCGCPGVFLISMSGDDSKIDPAAALIRRGVPELKIGINRLTSTPLECVEEALASGYDAAWSDYSWQDQVENICGRIGNTPFKFFAAVAMKGETHDEPYPEKSAFLAKDHGFIPMTSGSGTGVTAPFDKIRNLSYALGSGSPLAMSGVHPPLAHNLVPYTTHWLVATAISKDFYRFDEDKLKYLKTQSVRGEYSSRY
jgi:hypothetical protein